MLSTNQSTQSPKAPTTAYASRSCVTSTPTPLERALARNFARFGLTNASYDVLATLRRSGPPYQLSPTQLYQSLMISSGTVTNRLDQLERAGLVARLPDPTDRRGTIVELTSQGRELVDAVVQAHAETELHLVSVLTDDEKAILAATLRKLLLTLERDDEASRESTPEALG